MKTYWANIEEETVQNEHYRKVLYTGKMQLAVMSLKPEEDIPTEVHDNIDQFIRVEQGEACIKVDDKEFNLNDEDIIIIPAGSKHYVKNSSTSEKLKIYTIYSPAEHPPKTIHKTQADAEDAEH